MAKDLKGVMVVWEDATTTGGWVDPREARLATIVSVGVYCFEDKEKIVLTHGLDIASGHGADCFSIPKAWIKKRKYLKL